MKQKSQPQKPDEAPRGFMAEALSRMKRSLGYVFLFSLCTNILMLAMPIYSLQVLDRVVSSASVPTLVYLTLVVVAGLLFFGMFSFIRSSILLRMGEWLDTQVSAKLLALGVSQNAAGSPVPASIHLRDMQSIKGFLTGMGVTSLFDAPWSIIFLAVIFLIHPVLGFITLAGAVILFTLAVMNEMFTRKPHAVAGRIQMRSMEIADAASRNAEAVEAMGMMDAVVRQWGKENNHAQEVLTKASGRSDIIQNISKITRMLIQVAIIGVSGFYAIHAEITGGGMIAASIVAGRALAPFETAIGLWKNVLAARTAFQRLEKNVQRLPHERGEVELPAPEGRITLEQLVYAPAGQKPIIKGISFEIKAGEMLGIIGPSAAGKSTLARLMIGVLAPSAGAVRLDGADIFKWNRQLLGPYVGYMPQQVELFHGTVLENIARMSEQPNHAQVIDAAKKAGVHDLILQLPEGYETVVRPGNATLTPGQRQRIGLARALYGTPRFIVLDEPNASLDGEGEMALMQALSVIRAEGITCVVVAHRPSLVRHTDKILILQQGMAKEFGETQQILGRYLAPHAARTVEEVA